MASLLTHLVVSAALCEMAPLRERPARVRVAAVLVAILPDADVWGLRFGIRYGDLWGHRGLTHSLTFALLSGLVVAWVVRRCWRGGPRFAALAALLVPVAASHGLLDAMTHGGGLGVAFFSPFDPTRYYLPARPLLVSPIGLEYFFTERGMRTLRSEVLWVWLPMAILVVLARLARVRRRSADP